MATSLYLKNYSIVKINSGFKVSFEIPSNCDFIGTIIDNTNFIKVSLNPGARKPDTVFKIVESDYKCDADNNLIVEFQIPDDAGKSVNNRPKIMITDI